MTDSWERLSLYESRDLLSRFFRERHGRQLEEKKACEIIAHLTQGRGFFESAQKSSELVRPLLLYYGVQALSRGLILFLEPRLREFALSPSHGVATKAWQGILSQEGIDGLPNLLLNITTSGTFRMLSEVTRNVDRCLVHEVFVSHSPRYLLSRTGTATITIEPPITISIKMVLERLVDLGTIFATTFESPPQCFQVLLRIRSEDTGTDICVLDTELEMPDVGHIFPTLGQPTSKLLDGINGTFYCINHASKSELLAKLPPIKSDMEGKTYIVRPLPNDLDLSTLALLYLIAYSMGMLARYFPSKWQSLLNSSKGDFAFPLMKAATRVVEERFPQLVLQELEQHIL
jgi:hypothetical protein